MPAEVEDVRLDNIGLKVQDLSYICWSSLRQTKKGTDLLKDVATMHCEALMNKEACVNKAKSTVLANNTFESWRRGLKGA